MRIDTFILMNMGHHPSPGKYVLLIERQDSVEEYAEQIKEIPKIMIQFLSHYDGGLIK